MTGLREWALGRQRRTTTCDEPVSLSSTAPTYYIHHPRPSDFTKVPRVQYYPTLNTVHLIDQYHKMYGAMQQYRLPQKQRFQSIKTSVSSTNAPRYVSITDPCAVIRTLQRYVHWHRIIIIINFTKTSLITPIL